jgi:hypothetical protein
MSSANLKWTSRNCRAHFTHMQTLLYPFVCHNIRHQHFKYCRLKFDGLPMQTERDSNHRLTQSAQNMACVLTNLTTEADKKPWNQTAHLPIVDFVIGIIVLSGLSINVLVRIAQFYQLKVISYVTYVKYTDTYKINCKSSSYLKHLVVESVQNATQKLFGILLATLYLEHVRSDTVQNFVYDDRFEW